MKAAIFLTAAALSVANAKPHGHGHVHHRREPAAVTVSDAVATAYAFVLDGQTISQDDVCNGIANGDLKWDGDAPTEACAAASSLSSSAVPTTTVAPTTSSTSVAVESTSSSSPAPTTSSASVSAAEFFAASSSSSVASTTSSSSAAASTTASSSSSASDTVSSILGDITKFVSSLAQSDYDDFPDGELDCSAGPPTKYGAIPVDYLGLGGWTSLQKLNSAGDDITGDGVSGDTCVDGMSCSYSCAPGWQKLQWATTQPSDGASIGGLLCKEGKLYKANSNSKLCGQGNGLVYVKNKSGENVSVCRTDYPGNEAENVPVDVSDGDTQPLTCPIEEDYYTHLGSSTSAQYYLNPLGISADPGCSWDGDGNGDSGNAAPINFGVGQKDGTTWLSIFQNSPTTYTAYEGKVEIQGDGLSGECYYENGSFCGVNGCETAANGGGCTVSTTSTAYFVVSSS